MRRNPGIMLTLIATGVLALLAMAFPMPSLVADGGCYNTSLAGTCGTNVTSYTCNSDTFCDVIEGETYVITSCEYQSHVQTPVALPPGDDGEWCSGDCVVEILDNELSSVSAASTGLEHAFDYSPYTPCQQVFGCDCNVDYSACVSGSFYWSSSYDFQESYADGEWCSTGS